MDFASFSSSRLDSTNSPLKATAAAKSSPLKINTCSTPTRLTVLHFNLRLYWNSPRWIFKSGTEINLESVQGLKKQAWNCILTQLRSEKKIHVSVTVMEAPENAQVALLHLSHTSEPVLSKTLQRKQTLQYHWDVKMTDSTDTQSLGRKQLLRHTTRDWEVTVSCSKTIFLVCCGQCAYCARRPACLLSPASRCATYFLGLPTVSVSSFRWHRLFWLADGDSFCSVLCYHVCLNLTGNRDYSF